MKDTRGFIGEYVVVRSTPSEHVGFAVARTQHDKHDNEDQTTIASSAHICLLHACDNRNIHASEAVS